MKWQEVRKAYPNQWLVIEAVEAHTEEIRRLLDQIAVVETSAGGAAALQAYERLHRAYPQREFYFVHTGRESLDIRERSRLGVLVTEQQIDQVVIEQADDDTAWDEPVRVKKHSGGDFDDYLREVGILEEVSDKARRETAAMSVGTEFEPRDNFIRKLLKKRTPKAKEYVDDPNKLAGFADQVRQKLNDQEDARGPLDEVWDYVVLLLRLIQAYIRREYTEVPGKSLVLIVAALIYFVNPLDILPDTIPGVGFIDDAAVVAFVIRQLKVDLDKYRAWEIAHEASAV